MQLTRCSDEKFFGDLDKQISACTWLLESGKLPEDKVNYIWLMRGWGHYANDNYKQAVSDLTYYVESMPEINHAPLNKQTYIYLAHERIAYAFAQLGDSEAALGEINSVIEMGSHLSSAYHARARIHRSVTKDLDQAVADYTKALSLSPEYYGVLVDRAYAYLELEEYAKAIVDFKEAIEADREPVAALNGLAWFYATTNTEHRRARIAISLARRLKTISDDPRHLDTLAAAYAAGEDYTKAAQTQEKALATAYRSAPLTDEERQVFEKRLALYESGKVLFCPGMPECD